VRPSVALAFAYLSFMWGSSYLFIKIGLAYAPPFFLAAARNSLAAVAMVAAVLVLRRAWPRGRSAWLPPVLFGLMQAMAFALLFWGQQFVPSGRSAVLVATVPLFTLFLSRVMLKERIVAGKLVAVLVGFAGVLLALGDRTGAGFAGTAAQQLLGQAAILGTSLCYAVSYVYAKKAYRADRYVNVAIHLFAAGLALAGISALFDPPATAAVWT
jgi:drug/metabolite transporter (DMT)-like permease